MANLCEIRGGKGCAWATACGLRSVGQRCRGYVVAPVADMGTPAPTPTPTPADDAVIGVTISIPGIINVGLKL